MITNEALLTLAISGMRIAGWGGYCRNKVSRAAAHETLAAHWIAVHKDRKINMSIMVDGIGRPEDVLHFNDLLPADAP